MFRTTWSFEAKSRVHMVLWAVLHINDASETYTQNVSTQRTQVQELRRYELTDNAPDARQFSML